MSWITDVILIFNIQELFSEEGQMLEEAPALGGLNNWLAQQGRGPLDNLDEHVLSSGKVMQACVYGGAYSFLKADEFVQAVKSQAWRQPENVQLLLQDEEEPRFTIYTLT